MAALLPSYILSDTASESSLASSPTTPASESWLDRAAAVDLDFIDLDGTAKSANTKNSSSNNSSNSLIDKTPLLSSSSASLLPSKATPLPLPWSSWPAASPTPFWSSTIWNNSNSSSSSITNAKAPSPSQQLRQRTVVMPPQPSPPQDTNYYTAMRRQSDFFDGPHRRLSSSSSSSSDKKVRRGFTSTTTASATSADDYFLLEQQPRVTTTSHHVPPTIPTTSSITRQNELSPELLQHIDDYFSPVPRSSSASTTATSTLPPSPPSSLLSTSPSQPPAIGDDTLSMGKGIPLHHLAPTAKLFTVELTHGAKPEVFYYVEDYHNNNDEYCVEQQQDGGLTVHTGDLVIVEADRGHDLGKVVASDLAVNDFSPDLVVRRLYRLATEAEIATLPAKAHDEAKALLVCQSKIKEKGLPMQVVSAEYQWDRRKLTFHFVAEERVDFRELVRELFKLYKTRIWMCAAKHPR